MESIVLELQRLAIDDKQNITELLRKALLVASKLKLTEFAEWATNELHGYKQADVPDYRKIRAEVKVDNPYHGLVPFILPQEIADRLCNLQLHDPIGTFVDLLSNPKHGTLTMPFPPEVATKLMQGQDSF